MAEKTKRIYSRELINKTVVSKSGKTFGKVSDLMFETRTGELISMVLKNPTEWAASLDLEKSKVGELKIPFNTVIAIGDFVVVQEEDII